uniref:Uncharacterized protein n=1 Tax=Glossina brevipalpis TaxID=37001 RepID=A0A1A9VZZ2_9MUSC
MTMMDARKMRFKQKVPKKPAKVYKSQSIYASIYEFLMDRIIKTLYKSVTSIIEAKAIVPCIEIGLNQELSMPEDSFVLHYFQSLNRYLSIGPTVYFLLKSGLSFSESFNQNMLEGLKLENSLKKL